MSKKFLYILASFILIIAFGNSMEGQSYPALKWQKFFGGGGDDMATCIDAGFGAIYVGGNVMEEGKENACTDILVMKMTLEGRVLWERELGGTGCEEVRDLVVTPDSGVIFCGVTGSFIGHPEKGDEHYRGDMFICKLDKRGEIDWMKNYGGLDLDQAWGIAKGGVNEYVIAGGSSSHNFDVQTDLPATNLFAVKLSHDGEKRATWVYGGDKHDWAYSITHCKNGDYVLAGFTSSEDIDGTHKRANGDGWVMRVNKYGTKKWERIYSGKFEDYFTDVIEDDEGRLVLVGNFESEKKGKQFWFLKLTADGKKIYERTFGGAQDEFASSIISAGDKNYMLAGYSNYTHLGSGKIKGHEDFWLIKLNPRGNTIWEKTFGGPDHERALDVIEYEPGVFFAVGTKLNDFDESGTQKRGDDFWVIRVDEEPCEQIPMDVSLSIPDFTTVNGKAFKCRALVDSGNGFLWDFGDGTFSRDKSPQKIYKEPGVFEIRLTVQINENCASTYSVPELIMIW